MQFWLTASPKGRTIYTYFVTSWDIKMFKTWEELSHKEQLASIHYDLYKDVHGIRPRWIDYNVMSEEDLEKELDRLKDEAEVVWKEEEIQKDKAEQDVMSRIQEIIFSGAKDIPTAIRWLHDTYETNGDNEYLDYQLGVRYGFIQNLIDK